MAKKKLSLGTRLFRITYGVMFAPLVFCMNSCLWLADSGGESYTSAVLKTVWDMVRGIDKTMEYYDDREE